MTLKPFLVGMLAALGLGAGVLAVGAQTDPYAAGTTGYDISYPQCGAGAPTGAFAIVGVNGGRPFSNNSCLAGEYSAAASLYINTGYSGAYRKAITSGCASQSKSIVGSSSQKQAWAIGCSEADKSVTYATGSGASSITMWWLDVETANSWSSSDLSLNKYTINGAAARLAQTGPPVGVYSNASMWATITGTSSFAHPNIAADWDTAGGACGTGFSGDPVWLVQSTVGGVDSDTAC
ncbi:MAG TPA: hypothetical protein VLU92_05860 [Candidatus Dormibacteraeota bacterium]|nr:hypothetical protein [Candidatus Dormibacteraeota bacterium]